MLNINNWGDFLKIWFVISVILNSIILCITANSYILIKTSPELLFLLLPIFVFVNAFAGTLITYVKNKRLSVCKHGTILLYSFYISTVLSAVYQVIFAIKNLPSDYLTVIWSLALCLLTHLIIFWNGILCVYFTSYQLGFKWRLLGIILGMIPIANLIVLFFIMKIATKEYFFETEKIKINISRKKEQICATKYPILLVHGVFFRDTKFFNYWGRIPKELEANGAKVFYGNHSSASSIADSADQLNSRINDILDETGADKLNIIAHSKGGLDCRYLIAKLGGDDKIASLTTINTPHRGCLFADYLLTKIPENIKNKVANTYNSTLKKFGEANSDFLAATNDLRASYCKELDASLPTPEGVFCQSFGSVLTKAVNGKFPLNFSYHLVKLFSGKNDGLVSEDSFKWGEKYTLLTTTKKRGISHGDMIDLNRENLDGFDVREFYVKLVNDLKNRGL